MKWNKLYKYPPSTRSLIEGNRHYDVSNEILPSVTTILQKTQTREKVKSLAKWQARVGDEEAERIRKQAALRGTAMHVVLEKYLQGTGYQDLTDEGQVASGMAQQIIEKGLSQNLTEIWGSEVTVYYPGLYAGATDLAGIFDYEESIIDFKQSNKPKRREWIEDYFLQLAAYAMAHNCIHGTEIRQGVILMCTPDKHFQQFSIKGKTFIKYQHKFLERVNQYYSRA
tara:strand:+ start:48 stop:725 length:678 start_codon:yes stop_codon:yes gene_type:complete